MNALDRTQRQRIAIGVVVTANDRLGASSPAVIDLTRRAPEELDFVKSGRTKVKLEVFK